MFVLRHFSLNECISISHFAVSLHNFRGEEPWIKYPSKCVKDCVNAKSMRWKVAFWKKSIEMRQNISKWIKIVKILEQCLNTSKRIKMRQRVSKWVRMRQSVSKCVRMRRPQSKHVKMGQLKTIKMHFKSISNCVKMR